MADETTSTHRRFLCLSLGFVLCLGLFMGAYAALGAKVVRTDHPADSFAAGVSIAISLYVLVALLYFAFRASRRGIALVLGVAFWWIGVETFAAPYLKRTLRLTQFHFVQDVDHLPTATGPKWNRHSLRASPEPEEFTDATRNVIFLGDSFTYGLKVGPRQAFPHVTGLYLKSVYPNLRVANFGWSSSSPLLSYRRLVDIGEEYKPDIVVLCIDMTDFSDDIRYQNMFEQNGMYWFYDKLPIAMQAFRNGAPELFKLVVSSSVGAPAERFFITEAPLEETRGAFAPLMANVTNIAQWCEQRDVQFVLTIMPRTYQYSDRESPESWERTRYTALGPHSLEPFRYFDEVRENVDYPVWSLLKDFQETDVFPTALLDDPHWNPAGHEVAAKGMARRLRNLIEE
jgi:hypothetical protein